MYSDINRLRDQAAQQSEPRDSALLPYEGGRQRVHRYVPHATCISFRPVASSILLSIMIFRSRPARCGIRHEQRGMSGADLLYVCLRSWHHHLGDLHLLPRLCWRQCRDPAVRYHQRKRQDPSQHNRTCSHGDTIGLRGSWAARARGWGSRRGLGC